MNNGYKVPVLTEGLDLQSELRKNQSNQNRMLNILNNLNESEDISPDTPEEAGKVCPNCGVEYVGDKCPQCGKVIEECDDKKQMTESFKRGKRRRLHESDDAGVTPDEVKDPEVAEEKPTNEADDDAGVTPDEVKDPEVAEETKVNESTRYRLTRVLTEYFKLCEAEEFDKAKELKEEEDVDIKVNADGDYEIKEADDEDIQKVTLSKEDLEGIEKVEESFSFGKSHRVNESRSIRRKKSTKASARRHLSESYRKTRIINAVQKLAMQEGISFSSKKLQRVVNEAYRINEAEIELPEEKAQTALEQAFNDAGVTVKDCETETNDGVLTAHLTLQDTDSEVFLGDVADEVENTLDGFDVDYDEPEISEADEDEVYVDFHFVPVITSESTEEVEDEPSITEEEDDDMEECDDTDVKKKVTESYGKKRRKLRESEDICPECGKPVDQCECNEDEEEDSITTNEDEEEDKNDDDVFESFAGGVKNVRCKINPAFIKPGQVIFDSDSKTVFQAMTESVATKKGFGLSINVFNSANSKLANLTEGAEVTLGAKGKYFLLRENPVK